MTDTALVVAPPRELTTFEIAERLFKSGFYPRSIRSPEQALAIVMTGHELGIGPAAALSNINIIDGKPTLSAQLTLALFIKSGERESLEISDDGSTCTVKIKRKGQPGHTETFSVQDAERLGLATKDNWRKQPKVMRKWRCVSAALRIVAPDLLLGLYSPDELGHEEHARNTPWRVIDDETGEVLFEESVPAGWVMPDVTEGEFKEVVEPKTDWSALDAL